MVGNCIFQPAGEFGAVGYFLRERGFLLYDVFRPKYDINRVMTKANTIFMNFQKLNL